jgi:hypothetical protein
MKTAARSRSASDSSDLKMAIARFRSRWTVAARVW